MGNPNFSTGKEPSAYPPSPSPPLGGRSGNKKTKRSAASAAATAEGVGGGKVKFMDKTWKTAFGRIGFRTFLKREYIKWYLIVALISVAAAFMTIYHREIVNWLRPRAEQVRELKYGWLIPVGILFVISFPPLFGHEIVTILCGLVWGLWLGFGIVALGTFLGEMGNYWAFKYACTGRSKKMETSDMNYACMCQIVREGGFWIAFLARLSAIPGHLVTPVFATTGMSLFVFVAATVLTLPKQLAAVYIGTLFDEDSANRTTASKAVEYSVLGLAFIVTIGAAAYIYIQMGKKRPEIEAAWLEKSQRTAGGMVTDGSGAFAGLASPRTNSASYSMTYGSPMPPTAAIKERPRDPKDPRAHYRQSDGYRVSNAVQGFQEPIRYHNRTSDEELVEGLVSSAAHPAGLYADVSGQASTSTIDLPYNPQDRSRQYQQHGTYRQSDESNNGDDSSQGHAYSTHDQGRHGVAVQGYDGAYVDPYGRPSTTDMPPYSVAVPMDSAGYTIRRPESTYPLDPYASNMNFRSPGIQPGHHPVPTIAFHPASVAVDDTCHIPGVGSGRSPMQNVALTEQDQVQHATNAPLPLDQQHYASSQPTSQSHDNSESSRWRSGEDDEAFYRRR